MFDPGHADCVYWNVFAIIVQLVDARINKIILQLPLFGQAEPEHVLLTTTHSAGLSLNIAADHHALGQAEPEHCC